MLCCCNRHSLKEKALSYIVEQSERNGWSKEMNYTELEMPKKGDRVVVGMSGGVDSTMTAILLKEKGCEVIGVTMSLWKGDLPPLKEGEVLRESCYGPGEEVNIAECKKFCEDNGIQYHVIDVKDEYQKQVLDYFKAEYRAGRTPNPCIRCNRFIKFGALLAGIKSLGIEFDYFCTGHYAKVVRGDEPISSAYKNETQPAQDEMSLAASGQSRPAQIATALDVTKDQAYFLYRIPTAVLEKVRFPLADYTKKQVYDLAREHNLAAANRAESQDFIPDVYLDYLFQDKPSVPGDIIDMDGHVLGKHRGIEHYTIGQRRGLGVSAKEPLYVAAIDKVKNLVVLGKDSDLFCTGLIADDFVWPADYDPQCAFDALVKIRLAARPVPAHVAPYEPKEGEVFTGKPYLITFEEPQRAVAPGQSVVMYKDGVTACGGIISAAIHTEN